MKLQVNLHPQWGIKVPRGLGGRGEFWSRPTKYQILVDTVHNWKTTYFTTIPALFEGIFKRLYYIVINSRAAWGAEN